MLVLANHQLQAQNRIVSAGYTIPEPPAFSAGQVVTLFVRGLNVSDAVANTLPLPTTLSGVTVRVKSGISGYPEQLPIFSVLTYDYCAGRIGINCPLTHITVQMPTEPTCVPTGQFPNECTIGPAPVIVLNVQVNGVPGEDFPVLISYPEPHILNSCDTIFGLGSICTGYVTHADGTLVKGNKPARRGETIVIYAVGLGTTNPAVKTGEPSPPQSPTYELSIPLSVSFRVTVPPTPLAPVVWSPLTHVVLPSFIGLVPGFVGLYQINFVVPTDTPQNLMRCAGEWDVNARIAIGAGGFGPTDGQTSVDICVQP
ncbi:MAG TPA: hypothetical protein VJN43_11610 [Bryobacteraceae bacterium]|nr:hypothetical protein [Bryobacteraceae bacterium]